MNSEHDPSDPAHDQEGAGPRGEQSEQEHYGREQDELERIRISRHFRWEIKNLLDYINWATTFPNDREIVRRLEEILTLVPPVNERDEALQEYIRRTSLGQNADAQKRQLKEEAAEGYLQYIDDCMRSELQILPLTQWRGRMKREK